MNFRILDGSLSGNGLLYPAISLLLCLCAASFAFYSRRHLHSERTIRETIARLSFEPDLFEASINTALAEVESLFGFLSLCLVHFDPENRSIRHIYGEQNGNAAAALFQDFASELRVEGERFVEPTLWRYPPSSRRTHTASGLQYRRVPVAAASIAMTTDRQAFMLMGERHPGLRNDPASAQVLRVIVDLLAQMVEKHALLAEMEQLKASLEETQTRRLEAVRAVAGAITHEFNNHLTTILGYGEIALDALDPESTTHWYIENILASGAKAREAVDQILTFSRRSRTPAKPLDLIDALTQVLPALYVCLPQRVRLRVEVGEPPLTVTASVIELQQILVNLCKNAGEAMPGGGEVALIVDATDLQAPRFLSHGRLPPGRYVRIVVADNGNGIASDHLSRIFDPLFTTKADGGAGLGLSVVHGIVHSWKGMVHVQSARGEGTRVELFLPYVESEEARKEGHDERSFIAASADRGPAIVDLVGAPD